MSQPTLTQITAGYLLKWETEQVSIEVARIREFRGATTCDIKIITWAPGYNPHLHGSQFSLVSDSTRTRIAKQLQERYGKLANWAEVLEQLCHLILEKYREGEPLVILKSTDTIEPPSYLAAPLIFRDQPNVVFGAKGSAKSYIATALAICIQLGVAPKVLGFEGGVSQKPVLYLDWESHYSEVAYRQQLLTRGLGLPYNEIPYRRCVAPLTDDLEQIQQLLLDNDVGFVVMDSVGPASGGDLNASEPALRLLRAVRGFGTWGRSVTTLLIMHTAKDDNPHKTAYGNVYYTNLPRSIWEVRKVQDINESTLSIGLFQRESNLSKLHRPLAYRLSFLDDATIIEAEDIRDVEGLQSALPIRMQLIQILRSETLLTVKELAEAIDKPEATIRTYLNRFKDKDFVRLGEQWGLKSRES